MNLVAHILGLAALVAVVSLHQLEGRAGDNPVFVVAVYFSLGTIVLLLILLAAVYWIWVTNIAGRRYDDILIDLIEAMWPIVLMRHRPVELGERRFDRLSLLSLTGARKQLVIACVLFVLAAGLWALLTGDVLRIPTATIAIGGALWLLIASIRVLGARPTMLAAMPDALLRLSIYGAAVVGVIVYEAATGWLGDHLLVALMPAFAFMIAVLWLKGRPARGAALADVFD